MSNLEIELRRRGIPDALNDIISRGVASSTEILNFIRSILPDDVANVEAPDSKVVEWSVPQSKEEMDALMEQHLRRGTFRISSGEEAREIL